MKNNVCLTARSKSSKRRQSKVLAASREQKSSAPLCESVALLGLSLVDGRLGQVPQHRAQVHQFERAMMKGSQAVSPNEHYQHAWLGR